MVRLTGSLILELLLIRQRSQARTRERHHTPMRRWRWGPLMMKLSGYRLPRVGSPRHGKGAGRSLANCKHVPHPTRMSAPFKRDPTGCPMAHASVFHAKHRVTNQPPTRRAPSNPSTKYLGKLLEMDIHRNETRRAHAWRPCRARKEFIPTISKKKRSPVVTPG